MIHSVSFAIKAFYWCTWYFI